MGPARKVIWASQYRPPEFPGVNMELRPDIARLSDSATSTTNCTGSNPDRVEFSPPSLQFNGLFNIALRGGRFGREIAVPIGRIHYADIRITGTVGYAPADLMNHIPQSSEVEKATKSISSAQQALWVQCTSSAISTAASKASAYSLAIPTRDGSLTLLKTAEPMAAAKNVPYKQYSPVKDKMPEGIDYAVIMAPVPELAAAAVLSAGNLAIINIFAGIPDTLTAKINLDAYIEKQMYFVGTSGSVLEDMKRELAKLESGVLDTNISVAAVCGLDGVLDGIRAIENRSIAGKIIAYPSAKDCPHHDCQNDRKITRSRRLSRQWNLDRPGRTKTPRKIRRVKWITPFRI